MGQMKPWAPSGGVQENTLAHPCQERKSTEKVQEEGHMFCYCTAIIQI